MPHPNTVIRTLEPQDWAAYRDTRLRALADSPDAYGSTLASEQARAADNWAARLAAAAVSGQDYPLIAEQAGAPVGLLWAKVDGDDAAVVNIFQVWVAPDSRGQGIAAALLRAAVAWARTKHARFVQLGVTCGDTAAGRLYAREGFRDVGAPEARAGSPLFEQPMRLALADAA